MSFLTSGSLVAGRYRLDALLGRGGVAEVWAAIDEALHQQVVVKVFDQDVARAFRASDEVELLTALRHDGLVAVTDVGAADATGCPYLVTEYVDGPSLRQRIDQGDPLPRHLVAEVGAQLAAALVYLHAAGLAYRGVQPGNVLLTTRACADGSTAITAKLMDFGTTRLKDSIRMTEYGAIGTSGHESSEVVRRADDVYSLGLVLLECFIGYVADQRRGHAGALAPAGGPPPVPVTVAPAWTHLLTGMFAAEPAHRPAASEVAASLRELAADARRLRRRLQWGRTSMVDLADAGVDPSAELVSRLHLVEDLDGWTLTMTVTPELLEALNAAQSRPRPTDEVIADEFAQGCIVHVEPNLLPGGPFAVAGIRIRRPGPDAPAQPDGSSLR